MFDVTISFAVSLFVIVCCGSLRGSSQALKPKSKASDKYLGRGLGITVFLSTLKN